MSLPTIISNAVAVVSAPMAKATSRRVIMGRLLKHTPERGMTVYRRPAAAVLSLGASDLRLSAIRRVDTPKATFCDQHHMAMRRGGLRRKS